MLKGAPRGQSNYYQECQRSNILITVLSVYVWQYLQCLVALSIKDLKYKVERKRVLFKVSGKINLLNTHFVTHEIFSKWLDLIMYNV